MFCVGGGGGGGGGDGVLNQIEEGEGNSHHIVFFNMGRNIYPSTYK